MQLRQSTYLRAIIDSTPYARIIPPPLSSKIPRLVTSESIAYFMPFLQKIIKPYSFYLSITVLIEFLTQRRKGHTQI